MWVPINNGWSVVGNPIQMDDLEPPHLWNPPYSHPRYAAGGVKNMRKVGGQKPQALSTRFKITQTGVNPMRANDCPSSQQPPFGDFLKRGYP